MPHAKTNFFVRLLLSVVAGFVFAQAPASGEDDTADDGPIELGEFPGIMIDEVVVPVPSEIFSIMGKLGQESFESEIVARKNLAFRDRSRLALAFGVAVADGFIAVQAQNQKGIEQAGRTALRLSEALGLKSRVLKHTDAIIKASEDDDWVGVRKELDRTQKTARGTMEEMRDGDLANCVSIGGWIRGTEAMTSLIAKSYKPDQAELLNQPELAKHFSKLIGAMPADVRAVEEVKAAEICLKRIVELMGTGEKVPDAQVVKEIHAASKALVEAVFTEDAKTDEGKTAP
jgi:hypothetical protein